MIGFKRALFVVPVAGTLVVGAASAAFSSGFAGIPAGTTLVKVQAGKTHTGINAAITSGAAIAGKVTGSGGAGLQSVFLRVISATGATLGSASSGPGGSYRIVSLPPSATGYFVCADGSFTSGGPSSFGYVRRCFGSTAIWSGSTPPKSAHKVPTHVGVTKANVNIALPSAGAIAGKVIAASGAAGLQGTIVEVFTTAGQFVTSSFGSASAYQVTGIAPGHYKACFLATSTTGGSSHTGYLSECWNNVGWNGGTVPSAAKAVTVTGNHQTNGVNAALSTGGAIAGTVRAAAAPHKVLQDSFIEVFGAGHLIAFGNSASNGTYKVIGLRSGSYKVCAVSGHLAGSNTNFNKGQCYKNVAWAGGTPSSKANAIAVKTTKTHVGVNLLLGHSAAPVGAIAGTVRSSGGKLLNQVQVFAYTSAGGFAGQAMTAPNGTYRMTNLRPSSTGYVVCFNSSAATPSSGTAPLTGYTNVCYRQRPWSTGSALPSHTTRISVKAGKTHTGVNAALGAGGAISGVIKHGSTPLQFVTVDIFNSRKQLVASAFSDSTGQYTAKGLTPSPGYLVCFAARQSFDTSASPTGYLSQCYKNKTWNDT